MKCQHRDKLDRHYKASWYNYRFCPDCGADLNPPCDHRVTDPITDRATDASELGHMFCPHCRVKL